MRNKALYLVAASAAALSALPAMAMAQEATTSPSFFSIASWAGQQVWLAEARRSPLAMRRTVLEFFFMGERDGRKSEGRMTKVEGPSGR